jgi:phosphoribosylformimino-5-aminoimidazole carboxamide ribonucleotide (ProFAR) isomerase
MAKSLKERLETNKARLMWEKKDHAEAVKELKTLKAAIKKYPKQTVSKKDVDNVIKGWQERIKYHADNIKKYTKRVNELKKQLKKT